MPRFDVYARPGGPGWVLDLQTDMIESLETRLVVPLLPKSQVPRLYMARLTPSFRIEGVEVVMLTHFMASVPASELRRPVTSLYADQDSIKAALDMIFLGF